MRPRHFLDTNVLLYSTNVEPADSLKLIRARELLRDTQGALSVQVLQEFFVQATRCSRANPLSPPHAIELIQEWKRYAVQDMTLRVFEQALRITERYTLSYWDSAIIAAALELGCQTLYSEDMSHGQYIEGLTIVNPFI